MPVQSAAAAEPAPAPAAVQPPPEGPNPLQQAQETIVDLSRNLSRQIDDLHAARTELQAAKASKTALAQRATADATKLKTSLSEAKKQVEDRDATIVELRASVASQAQQLEQERLQSAFWEKKANQQRPPSFLPPSPPPPSPPPGRQQLSVRGRGAVMPRATR